MSWMLSLIAVVVVGCAVFAARGYKGRVDTIGIDLGTTFSVVGVKGSGLDKEVKIVADSKGRRLFPSVVSFQPNGKVAVGYDAINLLSDFPLDTIYEAKRFIGSSIKDVESDDYSSHHPFRIKNVGTNVSRFGNLAFELSDHATGHEQMISPEHVATLLLKHLQDITAMFLGHSQVKKAVIAVPAKFDAMQRAATSAAYAAAGLKVVRVIEEPTAAAVAYQLHKHESLRVLVYDLGGGTLDVSILNMRQGVVEVYATDGDTNLGGSDFDLCIADEMHRNIEELTGQSILPIGDGEAAHDVALDLCILPSIRSKSEQIKKDLSQNLSAKFICYMPSIVNDSTDVDKKRYVAGQQVQMEVTRTSFHSVCSALFDRAILPVARLLDELEMDKSEIDEIVLVGGSSRIPEVKTRLRDFFGKELNDHIDPDITVAYGAASIVD